MENELYNPFQKIDFSPKKCFLTGKELTSETESVSVFPTWILDRYALHDKSFKMLEGSIVRYKDMKMPCADSVIKNALDPLEVEIEKAFSLGYEAVVKLPKARLYLWIAKIMFGVLYNDIGIEKRKIEAKGKEFTLPTFLKERYTKLHLILQSLVCNIDISASKLWSIEVFEIKISKDIFNYRDESTNLNFSLGMSNFGIVACMQDNGVVADEQQDIINTFKHKTLHPVQFEEICARFIYSNYLLNSIAEYTVELTDEQLIITSEPLKATNNIPLFEPWDDDMFAQVLAVYWKPWGITKNEIITFGNSPISYLKNHDTFVVVEPESIELEY